MRAMKTAKELSRLLWIGVRMVRRAGRRAFLRASRSRPGQRLVHDPADGARAPPALRAASEAAIDLVGGRGARRSRFNGRPHVAVAENIARTNNHYELQPPTRVPLPLT